MSNPNHPDTLYFDLAKGGVLLLLIIALTFSLERSGNIAPPVASAPRPGDASTTPGTPSGPLAPGAPVIAPPVIADDGSVTISGVGTPGTIIEIWANGEKVGEVPVSESGTWVYSTTPEPGDYQVIAVTRDSDGSVLDQSSSVGLTVPPLGSSPGAVATAPSRPAPTPEPEDSSQPPAPEIVEAIVTVSGEVTVTGTGQPGSTVVIIEDGIEATTVVVEADGTFTVTYQSTVGEHVFEVQGGDTPPPDSSGPAGQGTPTAPEGTPVATAPAQPTPTPTLVPIPPGGLDYIVQPGEWLIDLARRYYGDATRWVDIYVATNTKATLDPSYSFLSDPNYVASGWKIFIPEG